MEILIATLIFIGCIALVILIVIFGVINFHLPLKDPESEYYRRKLEKELRKRGLDPLNRKEKG